MSVAAYAQNPSTRKVETGKSLGPALQKLSLLEKLQVSKNLCLNNKK